MASSYARLCATRLGGGFLRPVIVLGSLRSRLFLAGCASRPLTSFLGGVRTAVCLVGGGVGLPLHGVPLFVLLFSYCLVLRINNACHPDLVLPLGFSGTSFSPQF